MALQDLINKQELHDSNMASSLATTNSQVLANDYNRRTLDTRIADKEREVLESAQLFKEFMNNEPTRNILVQKGLMEAEAFLKYLQDPNLGGGVLGMTGRIAAAADYEANKQNATLLDMRNTILDQHFTAMSVALEKGQIDVVNFIYKSLGKSYSNLTKTKIEDDLPQLKQIKNGIITLEMSKSIQVLGEVFAGFHAEGQERNKAKLEAENAFKLQGLENIGGANIAQISSGASITKQILGDITKVSEGDKDRINKEKLAHIAANAPGSSTERSIPQAGTAEVAQVLATNNRHPDLKIQLKYKTDFAKLVADKINAYGVAKSPLDGGEAYSQVLTDLLNAGVLTKKDPKNQNSKYKINGKKLHKAIQGIGGSTKFNETSFEQAIFKEE